MPRLGVLGWPVAHSRSPAIHNAAIRALGLEGWRYQRLPVPPGLFPATAAALWRSGFAGANVTIPHKHAALALATQASNAARQIGAANTLSFDPDGAIVAENTDAPGLIAALGSPVHGQRALVLGAGGSARAVVWALREAGADEVSIWNRTPQRAQALAREMGVRAVSRPEPADLLVNCTPVGLGSSDAPGAPARSSTPILPTAPRAGRSASEHRTLSQLDLSFDQVGEYPCVVDLAYGDLPTPLLAAASAHGARTVDGFEVLVEQGALSLELWTGQVAPREVMREAASAPPEDD